MPVTNERYASVFCESRDRAFHQTVFRGNFPACTFRNIAGAVNFTRLYGFFTEGKRRFNACLNAPGINRSTGRSFHGKWFEWKESAADYSVGRLVSWSVMEKKKEKEIKERIVFLFRRGIWKLGENRVLFRHGRFSIRESFVF